MTREELLAQARWCDEAREEIADWAGFASEYFQDKYDLVEVLAKWQVRARELRAQAEAMPRVTPEMVAAQADLAIMLERLADMADARQARIEAMPRIVREGRDFDVKFHDNVAAQPRQRDSEPGHMDTKRFEVTQTGSAAAAPPSTTQPVAQVVCNPDGSDKRVIFHSHRALYETPLGTFLYAAPPDLAARVKRLDGLLNEAASVITDIHSIVPLKFAVVALLERIRAALAEGEK